MTQSKTVYRPTIQQLLLRNVLSFGPEAAPIELGPLTVLIGPNASGKSNVIEALSLLAAAPKDIRVPIREGGGAREWIWHGPSAAAAAEVEVIVDLDRKAGSFSYGFQFVGTSRGTIEIVEELIARRSKATTQMFRRSGDKITIYSPAGHMQTTITGGPSPHESGMTLALESAPNPRIHALRDVLLGIRFFRGFDLSRSSVIRAPQHVDLPGEFLLEDGSNLGIVLSQLLDRPGFRRRLVEQLRVFYDRVEDVQTSVVGGTIQVSLHEEGLSQSVPAARLSDGTLRWLCLLTVLLHPDPPPVICIEEPELGLHPDVIPELGKLLEDAATRTQLIVTTHSDTLVDHFTDRAEVVAVAERGPGGTEITRFTTAQLQEWLGDYSLGAEWRSGTIGGNRW